MLKIEVGDSFQIEHHITDKLIRQFADLSGDFNPIHLDENFAAKTQFKKRISHGMLSGALISAALTKCFGQDGFYLSQSLKFLHPIFVNDKVYIQLKVTSVKSELEIALIETIVCLEDGKLCVKGEAMIKKNQKLK